MKNVFQLLHASRCHSHGAQWVGWLPVLLITIRLTAGFLCASCFNEIEQPSTRSFHLHAGDDKTPCHHGKANPSPLNEWACSVNQDDPAFILPEIPQLPAIASLFSPAFLLVVSYGNRPLLVANGRGPPPDIHFV